ncbi:MAG: virion morphogenesis protein [Burkholderiales bacterium]|nr:MAG: virion morphogenesis protein [Burkholderiales bacterium]
MAGVATSGVRELRTMIARARSAGRGTELLDALAQSLSERMALRFETKTDPTGTKWKDHEPSTTARYAAEDARIGNRRGRGSLLIRTGLMRASLTRERTARDVLVGFARPYAVFHEFGTRRMPRRGLVFADPEAGKLSDDDIAALLKTGERWFALQLGGKPGG